VTEFIAYALVVLNIVLGAAVIWVLGYGAFWLLYKAFRRPAARAVEVDDDLETESAFRRECGKCHRSWVAKPGVELSRFGVWLRMRARLYQRNHNRPETAWSRQKAWGRCPSCLSTYVFECDEEARQVRREERAARRAKTS
jgi:hypothetical protein